MPLSKATASVLIGVSGNLLEMLVSLPLLGMPLGAGVKPMTLPLLIIIIAAGTIASCAKLSEQTHRPDGSKLVRFIGNSLCLLPLFAGVFFMHLFAAMRNLSFG